MFKIFLKNNRNKKNFNKYYYRNFILFNENYV